jgi:hypothetical protein
VALLLTKIKVTKIGDEKQGQPVKKIRLVKGNPANFFFELHLPNKLGKDGRGETEEGEGRGEWRGRAVFYGADKLVHLARLLKVGDVLCVVNPGIPKNISVESPIFQANVEYVISVLIFITFIVYLSLPCFFSHFPPLASTHLLAPPSLSSLESPPSADPQGSSIPSKKKRWTTTMGRTIVVRL